MLLGTRMLHVEKERKLWSLFVLEFVFFLLSFFLIHSTSNMTNPKSWALTSSQPPSYRHLTAVCLWVNKTIRNKNGTKLTWINRKAAKATEIETFKQPDTDLQF